MSAISRLWGVKRSISMGSMLEYLLLFFVWFATQPAVALASVAARVNGEKILETEVASEMKVKGDSRDKALERLISRRLVLQQAKKLKLDSDPDVRRELDAVVYQSFVSRKYKDAKDALEPTDNELHERYTQWPFVRLKHLALVFRTEAEKDLAQKDAITVNEKLQLGEDFSKLVLAYSQVDSVKLGGDLDYRGLNTFGDAFVAQIRPLGKGQVAGPFESDGALHFVQLVETKNFADAPATYLQSLRSQLRQEKREAHLEKLVETLKKNSKIDIVSAKGAAAKK